MPTDACIAFYRDERLKLLDECHCNVLEFDLTGVVLIPSGMLGLMTTLRKKVERVELYNQSPDIREILLLVATGAAI